MRHLCSVTAYVLSASKELKARYSDLLERYRRLMNQLHALEQQENRSEAELIRDGDKWVPYPVLIELCAYQRDKMKDTVVEKALKNG